MNSTFISKSVHDHIRALRYVRSCITLDVVKTAASALVSSHLDYANCIFDQLEKHF